MASKITPKQHENRSRYLKGLITKHHRLSKGQLSLADKLLHLQAVKVHEDQLREWRLAYHEIVVPAPIITSPEIK